MILLAFVAADAKNAFLFYWLSRTYAFYTVFFWVTGRTVSFFVVSEYFLSFYTFGLFCFFFPLARSLKKLFES